MKFLLFFFGLMLAIAVFAFGLEESGLLSKRPDDIQVYNPTDPKHRQSPQTSNALQTIERFIRATDPRTIQPELVQAAISFEREVSQLPDTTQQVLQGQVVDRALAVGSHAAKAFNRFAANAANDAVAIRPPSATSTHSAAGEGGKLGTAYFFVNGVGMNLFEAVRSTVAMETVLTAQDALKPSDGVYLLYNPTRGAVQDSAEFALQYARDALMGGQWGELLYRTIPWSAWPFAADRLALERSLERVVGLGFDRVVLVGHSQGTFFVQDLHDSVAKRRANSSGVHAILLGAVTRATPASGQHITLSGDSVVNWVRRNMPGGDQVLPANVVLNADPLHPDASYHLARQSYFELAETKAAFVSAAALAPRPN